MNITVVGAGYVGLVTAACLAELGHQIDCVENDPTRLAVLQAGAVPIYEVGLPELVARNVARRRLAFTDEITAAVRNAEVIFLCVGTPPGPFDQPDLSQIEAVATAIGEALDACYRVIVTKSTVPVGCGDWVRGLIREAFCAAAGTRQPVSAGRQMAQSEVAELPLPHFDVVSNPEFLREGTAIEDMMFPDRIVLGSESRRALELMRELYRPLLEQSFPWERPRRRSSPVPLVESDLASAEMIKYAANAFLATKISFINEIANICERTGADVRTVARGIGLDHRIGEAFLQAGLGWGGSCFPKDVAALIAMAADYGHDALLLKAAREVNRVQRQVVVQKLQNRLRILKGKTVGLLGVAFKAGTDDVRDSPALTVAQRLMELGARVRAYDPHVTVGTHARLPLTLVASVTQLAEGADALVLITDWPEFRELPFPAIARLMRLPVLVDGRNFLNPDRITASGLEYIGIGC